MKRSFPWLDPATTQAAIAFAILAAIANGVWILIDNSTPSWDQAHYLTTTLHYQEAMNSGGPADLLDAINSADPSHGPLFTVLLLPFVYVFGLSASSGLVLNLLIAPVLYFCAGEIAWTIFRSWFARLLTIFLVATMPVMVGLFHNVLQDFLLVTLTTVSILLLLRSELFTKRWTTWGMALAMGLGTLTKVTFPLFVAGPVLIVVAQLVARAVADRRGADEPRLDWRTVGVNLGAAALVYLVVAGIWYGPNFSETLEYVRSTTSGPLAEGAGPKHPMTFEAISSFTEGVINFNLSLFILSLGLVALALNRRRIVALFDRPLRADPLWKLGFLLSWAVIPYLSVALAHNQDVRLMAPAFPAVAILVAGAVAAVRQRNVRLALTGVAALFLVYQTLNHVTDVTPGLLPDRARVAIGAHEVTIPFGSESIGYERLPAPDLGTPVMEYMEEVAEASPGGAAVPRTVCLLESEAVINGNTMGFLREARESPFEMTEIVTEPGGTPRELEERLSGCDFALYVKPPRAWELDPENRLAIVNEPFAAGHMTPRMFALFRGPSRVFPIIAHPRSPDEPGYLSTVGGKRVRVLVRTPGQGPIGG